MKYNLCSSCVHFQPLLITEEKRIPKSCNCPVFSEIFSPAAGGFPTGIDIIHCDYHIQFSPWFGDVFLHTDDMRGVSYVLTQPRNFKLIRCPKLYDNSKNIKLLQLDIHENEFPREQTVF